MTLSFENNIMEYDLNDIKKIQSSNIHFKISEDIINLIKSISDKVGAPSYIKTPNFNKKRDEKKKKRIKNTEINDEDWAAIRDFQATEKIEKEGVEKLIDNIRCELNKLSDKNYDKQKNKVLELMSQLMNNNLFNEEEKQKVVKLIFSIASTNKFYSKIYAQLYKDLIHFYSCMKNILYSEVENYKGLFETIEYIEPDKDYEQYCKNNKTNETRRALTSFIVNLAILDIVPLDTVVSLLQHLKDKTKSMIQDEKQLNIVCEITENIFILIVQSKEILKNGNKDTYDEIYEFVKFMKSLKPKENKGLNNKTIFKYMDIFDELEK